MEQFGDEENKKLLSDCADIERGSVITRENVISGDIPVVAAGIEPSCYHNVANRKANIITVSASGANAGYVNYWNIPIFASDCNTVNSKDYDVLDNVFLYCRLRVMQDEIFAMQRGAGQPHVNGRDLAKIEVPIPSIDRQKEYSEFVRQSDKSKFATQLCSNLNLWSSSGN